MKVSLRTRPINKYYKAIENAQKKIEEIRKKCKHKRTHMGMYSWRIGAVDQAELCDACDAVIPNTSTTFQGKVTSSIGLDKITIISDGNNSSIQLGGTGL